MSDGWKMGCLFCGVYKDTSKSDFCHQDHAKDLLVDGLKKDQYHVWVEVKRMPWDAK